MQFLHSQKYLHTDGDEVDEFNGTRFFKKEGKKTTFKKPAEYFEATEKGPEKSSKKWIFTGKEAALFSAFTSEGFTHSQIC